jgi:uncharacterized protein (DUF1499 family)
MKIARIVVLVAALAAFLMLVASGPGTRAGIWSWQIGLGMLRWATYTGLAAGVGAVALILTLAMPRWRQQAWMPVAALCLSLLAAAPPMMLLQQAKNVPPIHDITTDPFDPPVFVSLMEMRKTTPNGADYGGTAIASQQQKAYPDIRTVLVKSDPQAAMQRVIDAARAGGWDVVASDAPSGRLEATDTTMWFGFKDDIVVRVRPEGSGSRIDIRSVSRVGRSDIGTNAKRIREFLARVA